MLWQFNGYNAQDLDRCRESYKQSAAKKVSSFCLFPYNWKAKKASAYQTLQDQQPPILPLSPCHGHKISTNEKEFIFQQGVCAFITNIYFQITWQQLLQSDKSSNVIVRDVQETLGEKRSGGRLREVISCDDSVQVLDPSGISDLLFLFNLEGRKQVLFLKNFMSKEIHEALWLTSQQLHHGFYGFHNDYRTSPYKSGK